MYWIVYTSVLALLIVAAVIMDKKNNILEFIPGLLAYVFGVTGLIMGSSMPTIDTVTETGVIKEKKYCIPGRYTLHDGTLLRVHWDSTYVINESRYPLCLETVQYVRNDYMGDSAFFSHRDTVNTHVLRFCSKDVSAFVEAPSSLKATGNESVRIITVVSLERQQFSPVETYRHLSEPDDFSSEMYNYSNL